MLGCIIQARMGSFRLHGKVMMKVDGINPIIYYVINQVKNSKYLEKIVVATTDLKEDDIIEKYLNNLSIPYFRGKANDVLDRYYQCAKKFSFSEIVRITSDNPLIDPNIIDSVIKKFLLSKCDYATNTLPRTFPYGTELEVFSFSALENAWKNAKLPSEREHVTPYIRKNKKKFRIENVTHSKDLSNFIWTVDRIEDFRLIQKIVSKIKNRPILLQDILQLFQNEPDLRKINVENKPEEGYLKSLENDKKYFSNN